MVIDYYNVKQFWEWFKTISEELYYNPNDGALIKSLDLKVANLGPFDWEIGPTLDSDLYFAISPNLNIDLMPAAKEIVASAIPSNGWLFLAAKPEKGFIEEWDMLNEFNQAIHINIMNWQYILFQFEDNSFDMDLIVDNIQETTSTTKLAAEIALTNILGEEEFVKWIKNIRVLPSKEISNEGNLTMLKNLKKHLYSIISKF